MEPRCVESTAPIQDSAGITPTPTTPVRPLSRILIPLNERPDILPLRFNQIGHAFYLRPIGSPRKCLFHSFIGEMGSSPLEARSGAVRQSHSAGTLTSSDCGAIN